MKLKLGELNAVTLCQYTSFAEVVNQAFGEGGGGTSSEKREDLAQAPSYESALNNINNALMFG